MKLLGWMHRKFKQNNHDPFKDFSIGQASLDELQYHPKPNYYSKPVIKATTDNQLRKSFASAEAERIDEEELEEAAATISNLFHGFLAIGTLGTEPVNIDPSTPTFSISVENIMEKNTEVTENELKLINDELERVLGADESCNLSSGRNSHVSAGRNSHVSTGRNSHVSTGRSSTCSTITLSGKPSESTENSGNGTIVCPLQEYLLGSAAVGFPETTSAAKKENRTSLGELFQRTKMTEDYPAAKSDRGEKKMEKETDKSAVFLLKKLLKKKLLQASRSSAGASEGTTDSASAENKLPKILHLFRRKVHPESSTASRKSHKPTELEVKTRRVSHEKPYHTIEGSESTDEHITIVPQRAPSNGSIRRFKCKSNPAQLMLNGANSFGNGEHWIKTDSDYLVLEL